MYRRLYLLVSCSIASFYWLLDAYTNVFLYGTSFVDELLLKTPHNSTVLKIFTALVLFLLSFIPLFWNKNKVSNKAVVPLDDLQHIANILFSSLSTKVNTLKSLEVLEKTLHLESAMLFLYNKETFSLYNENEFIRSAFHSKEILPLRAHANGSEIEKIALRCYAEKSLFSKDSLTWQNNTLTLYSFGLKEDKSEQVMGSLMIATKTPNVIETQRSMIQHYTQMLTFILSLTQKKELLQEQKVQYINENSHYDSILNIMTFVALQEHIKQEFIRYKRYHIPATLVLIEINMLKNIANIFPANVLTNTKKDFIQLIKKNIRDVDIFAKWNNDQYALLLPNVDFKAGQGVALKLQALLEKTKFSQIGTLTCNFGITPLSPKDTIAAFRSRAESALASAALREGNGTIELKLQTEY